MVAENSDTSKSKIPEGPTRAKSSTLHHDKSPVMEAAYGTEEAWGGGGWKAFSAESRPWRVSQSTDAVHERYYKPDTRRHNTRFTHLGWDVADHHRKK
jgi:hypothetical protein